MPQAPTKRSLARRWRDQHARLEHELRLRQHELRLELAIRSGLRSQWGGLSAILERHLRKAGPRRDAEQYLRDTEHYMTAPITPAHRAAYEGAAEFALDEVGIGGAFDLSQPRAAAYAKNAPIRFAKKVNAGTIKKVRHHLNRTIELKETYEQTTKRMQKVFDIGPEDKGRARRIARTETNKVVNRGQLDGYKASKVVQTKRWLAAFGAREAHEAASGQVVPLDDPFIVDGEELQHPGDPSGSPGNIINCRCVLQPWETDVKPTEKPKPKPEKEMTREKWIKSLSKNEEDAIASWAGGGAQSIRKAMIGEKPDELGRAFTKSFKRAISRAPRRPGRVYRGLQSLDDDALKMFTTADTIEFKAHSSTSRLKEVANDFSIHGHHVLLDIRSQRSGVDIATGLQRIVKPGEFETVIPGGTKFKVISRRVTGGAYSNYVEIVMEEI